MLEAHNSLFNYDIISLCETSLTDESASNVPEFDGYTFVPANHPDNVPHGGVGIFYKNSLPLIVRQDLSFNESLVVELKFQRKKIFFTVLYRSPSFKQNSLEFQNFLTNFKTLNTNLKAEKPFAMFFTGDSTPIPAHGGLMVTPTWKVEILTPLLTHSISPKSWLNQQMLHQIAHLRALT